MKQEELDQLLSRLHDNREQAGVEYNRLRQGLTNFCRLVGHSSPEDAADRALDIVAAKLASGELVHNIASFSRGVARLLGKEDQRKLGREEKKRRDPSFPYGAPVKSDDRKTTLMQRCFNRLLPDDRVLLIRYHPDVDVVELALIREMLARELGITLNALRLRVHRLGLRLETCLRAGQQ